MKTLQFNIDLSEALSGASLLCNYAAENTEMITSYVKHNTGITRK
jgi:hypothetical protein